MSVQIYQITIPVFIHKLENLAHILKKGQEHALNKKIDESVFINARLAPDMFPLARQVQIACDTAKIGSARLAGIEFPAYEDNEKTFDELQIRIKKTIDFLKTISAEKINDAAEKKISYHQRNKDYNFIGLSYLVNHVTPNLYFHITAAYAILRHNGVDVGKKDYLGSF